MQNVTVKNTKYADTDTVAHNVSDITYCWQAASPNMVYINRTKGTVDEGGSVRTHMHTNARRFKIGLFQVQRFHIWETNFPKTWRCIVSNVEFVYVFDVDQNV